MFQILDFIFQLMVERNDNMSVSNIVIREPRGFAGLIANIMNPLNEDPKFKQAFKNTERRILINATNLHYAALLTIDKGSLKVESVRNEPKTNLAKKISGWNGYVAMDTQIFLALATKRLSLIQLGVKFIKSEVKLKGIIKLLVLLKLLKMLTG